MANELENDAELVGSPCAEEKTRRSLGDLEFKLQEVRSEMVVSKAQVKAIEKLRETAKRIHCDAVAPLECKRKDVSTELF